MSIAVKTGIAPGVCGGYRPRKKKLRFVDPFAIDRVSYLRQMLIRSSICPEVSLRTCPDLAQLEKILKRLDVSEHAKSRRLESKEIQ